MRTITTTELEANIDKYIKLGQEEEIEVTHRGKTIFYITPQRLKLLQEWEALFGSLPREAYYDKDIDRE